jgi:hypothetical protein
VGVGVGDPGTYWNVQVNSSTGLKLQNIEQKIAGDPTCNVLVPGTTGEVLKWKLAELVTVQESAGTPLTVKPPGLQPPARQLTKTPKSVGGVNKVPPQYDALSTLHVSPTVAVGVGVGAHGSRYSRVRVRPLIPSE